MFEKNFYTLRELADELNIGESTIRYWQDQFDTWVPCTGRGREKWYPKIAIDVLRFIMKQAEAGHGPEEIETRLKDQYRNVETEGNRKASLSGNPMGSDIAAPMGLQAVLEALTHQQKRIADAQERLAAATERNVTAIENSTQTHLSMIRSLETIAGALKGSLGQSTIALPSVRPSETVTTVDWESPRVASPEPLMDDLSELLDAGALGIEAEPPGSTEPSSPVSLDTSDDLTELLRDNETIFSETTDDPTDLIESRAPEMALQTDGLSDLLEENQLAHPQEMDDLADLIETRSPTTESQPDTLAELLEENQATQPQEMDDLADLIEIRTPKAESQPDDLAELLEGNQAIRPLATDDLSELLEKKPLETAPLKAGPVPPPPKKPKLTVVPDNYKSKMIAVIIGMKEKKKLSIAETVERLNSKGYKTISGEDQWSNEAIEQIYNHIDMVRVARERAASG